MRIAASLEAGSEHPLADAILRGAAAKGLTPPKVQGFEAVTGQGVKGTVDGRAVALGNARLMQAAGVDVAPLSEAAERRRQKGETVMLLADGGKLAGLVAVADPDKAWRYGGDR